MCRSLHILTDEQVDFDCRMSCHFKAVLCMRVEDTLKILRRIAADAETESYMELDLCETILD
jgi:hypothetical protein